MKIINVNKTPSNAPSKTGNPSGGGRGNNPSKNGAGNNSPRKSR